MTRPDEDLRRRLAESAAVRSMRIEQNIATCLRAMDWGVRHGSYFNDPNTGKEREIDIVAWIGEEYERRVRQSLTAQLFIEVKSDARLPHCIRR